MSARRKSSFETPPEKLARDKAMRPRTFNETDFKVANSEFIRRHARPGSIVLVGGSDLVEKIIRISQAPVADWSKALWSHIAIIEGTRDDGKIWMYSTDFDFYQRTTPGYVELPVDRFDHRSYTNVAVMNFDLSAMQLAMLADESMREQNRKVGYPFFGVAVAILLGLVTHITRHRFYSVISKIGRGIGYYARPRQSLICSCFVRSVYQRIGIELCPSYLTSLVMPEDIFKTPVLHNRFLLIREQRRKPKS